ncbi:DUF2806 domain-containing protein [Corallococcus sp. CA054B]|uniref:DUF2806 domain-containing protein n=1 Tax=Corallococcus sp. CA054B TaxID=2316734 RepID=UPI000EA31AC3|nr:DUF2806 domain-containing protein [Corallococcus sp. CA054B]RKG56669.1 DUF2806 domain-containing protein [Corallococcus sp. CA054B]
MEIKDLAGLSEPVQKLIQTVADGIGAVAYPWIVRREAKAIAEAHEILSESGLAFTSATMKSLPAQIASRVAHQEAKRQRNLGQVVDAAQKALPENVSGDPVDSDWINRFFAVAQEVSNEQMQQLWGRMLAGEVARPGGFSLRTIDCLRNMSTAEARLFSELCEFTFETNWGMPFLLFSDPSLSGMPRFDSPPNELWLTDHIHKFMSLYVARGFTDQSFRLLNELGLIDAIMGDGIRLSGSGHPHFKHTMRLGDRLLTIEHPDPGLRIMLPVVRLSSVGRELFQLHIPGLTPEFDTLLNQALSTAGCTTRWQPIPTKTGTKQPIAKPEQEQKSQPS